MTYDFAKAVESWGKPPIDDFGYIDSATIASKTQTELVAMAFAWAAIRYNGDRNHQGRWRRLMRLDRTTGTTVMDFGCGHGLEALEYALHGNAVVLADINPNNLRSAAAVLAAHDVSPLASIEVGGLSPFFRYFPVDIFHANGVLHHTPEARGILLRAVENLKPGGEIRLLLYSDIAWEASTGEALPDCDFDTATHPAFHRFVRHMDAVGQYADWYNEDKIIRRFGDFLDLIDCGYIGITNQFFGAILRSKA